MSQIDALNAVKNVKRRLIDHALEDHYVKDVQVRDACQSIWEGSPDAGGLVSDLWVEGAFPSKTGGSSLNERVENGSFSRRLRDLLDKNLRDRQAGYGADWTPRLHQAESMDEAVAGYAAPDKPAIVVTAGTGAGKTEAFLLPMLNDVFTHPREIGQGVSCIILYPLNALVKDQVDRLHGWLYGQKECRLFSFTGETPENQRELKTDRLPKHHDGSRLSTRQEARGREKSDDKLTWLPLEQQDLSQVPEILVTNYSMLEYMLSRPQDRVFFGKNLRTIILDEAHLYRGNLAAEIAMLLRRVTLRCGLRSQDIVHFATSATIGKSGDEGKNMLQEFASQLFSKPEQDVKVIQGQLQEEPLETVYDFSEPRPEDLADESIEWPRESLLEATSENDRERTQFFACENEDEWLRWEGVLRKLLPDAEVTLAIAETKKEGFVAPMLAKLLPRVGIMQRLHHELFDPEGSKRLRLGELAHRLFGSSSDTAVRAKAAQRLLQIGALARNKPEELPFLPNRIHALLRAPEGLSFCFDPDREVAPERRIPGLGYFFSPGQLAKENTGEKACLSVCRCKQSGRWMMAGVMDDDGKIREVPARLTWRIDQQIDLDEEDDGGKTLSDKIYFYMPPSEQVPVGMECQPQWLDTVTSMIGGEVPGRTRLILVKQCPDTGEDLMKLKAVRFFSTASRLSLSIAAESLLVEMPPVPGDRANWLPARGRRLLAFSDSRSEAARLGPRLQETHESQMIRAAIAREVGAGPKKEIETLRQKIEKYRTLDAELLMTEINSAEAEIVRLAEGFSVTELSRRLPQTQSFLAELIDFEIAKQHDVSKHAWSQKHWEENQSEATKPEKVARLLAVELSRRPSWPRPSLETTGLVEVCYPGISDVEPPHQFLDGLLSDRERELWRQSWPTFIALLCDELRNRGAVTTGDDEYDESRQLGKWARLSGNPYWQLIPLMPQREETRMGRFLLELVRRIEGGQRATLETGAKELLTAAFNWLREAKFPWCVSHKRQSGSNDNVDAIRIVFEHLRFRAPIELHQCELTGQVWPRAIYIQDSSGLVPATAKVALRRVVDEGLLDRDARIGRRRRDWRESEVFTLGIWAQEHSAQQDIKENARLQNLFKAGVRNMLSATTTLELGIDIGGLSGVLMGNLPPGKANYLQRAGRAGRRADGSSLVCGFARSSPYEREAFLHFAEYLNQDLPPPTVFLHREKIVRRHIHAFLLGEWAKEGWRKDEERTAPGAYGEMRWFTGHRVIPEWPAKDNWEAIGGKRKIAPLKDDMPPPDSPALRFRNYIESLEDPGWLAELKGTNEVLNRLPWCEIREEAVRQLNWALKSWIKDYNQLCSCWNEIIELKESQTALKPSSAGWAIKKQADALAELTVIEALGNALFIPRYGFPIGISKLIVREAVETTNRKGETTVRLRTLDQFKLERDSIMAMREYVPGSQILVGGQRITSHGISKHWTGENVSDSTMILRGRFKEGADGRFEFNLDNKPIPGEEPLNQMLFPKHGFVTAAWDPPVKSSDVERIGRAETRANAYSDGALPEDTSNFAGISGLFARFREGKKLVVLNKGDHKHGFAVCLRCGYAESEEHAPPDKLDQKLPKGFDKHQSLTAKPVRGGEVHWCGKKDAAPPKLRHQVLAATQITNFLMLDFSPYLAATDRELAATIAQALRLAGARLLHLDPREIRTLDPLPGISNPRGLAVVLYDSLAGGSGHVEELMRLGRAWLEETVSLLSVEDGSESDKNREAVRRLLTPETLDQDVDFTFKPLQAHNFLVKLMAGELNMVSFNPPPAASQPPSASALQKPSPPRKKQGSPSEASIKEPFLPAGALPKPLEWVKVDHPALPGGTLEGKWWYRKVTDKTKPHRVQLRESVNITVFEMSDEEFKQIKFSQIQPPA
jgi:Lhr-like helicase